MGSHVVQVLRSGQHLKELDSVCAAAGNIARELLHQQHIALAPSEGDGAGDLGARAGYCRGDSVDRLEADQIADIGNHPWRAGLNELIVVKLIEIFGKNR